MPDANDATAVHNSGNRGDLIRRYIAAKIEVDKQRADLNEQMGDERKTLREADISVKAADEMVRLKKMDQEVRDSHLDAWKEAFAAADLGYQGDMFLDAAE